MTFRDRLRRRATLAAVATLRRSLLAAVYGLPRYGGVLPEWTGRLVVAACHLQRAADAIDPGLDAPDEAGMAELVFTADTPAAAEERRRSASGSRVQ